MEEEKLNAKIKDIDFVGDTRTEMIIRWAVRIGAAIILSGVLLMGLALLTDTK